MQTQHISRYILTTGLQVDTPLDKKGPATQAATSWMKQHYPGTTSDKQHEYQLLTNSPENIHWTLIRLPLIDISQNSSNAAGETILTSLEDCPGTGIHARGLANFLITQLTNSQFHRQSPFLANG